MNFNHPHFGQEYRLARVAVRLRTFTVSELMRLTGIVDDTVYGFLRKLSRVPAECLKSEKLPRATRGRPVKRYTLTDAGVDYLLQKNARLAAILAGEEQPEMAPAEVITALQMRRSGTARTTVSNQQASTVDY